MCARYHPGRPGASRPRSLAAFVAALVAVVAFAWTPASARQEAMTLARLARTADAIMVGTVQEIRSFEAEWPGVGRAIFSDVTIAIEERWKEPSGTQGHASDLLTVRVPGGVLPDGRGMRASEAAHFTVHERVLVFTRQHLGRPWVLGGQQGKYRVIGRRVEGRAGYPVAEDVLSPTLERAVRRLLESAPDQPREGR